MIRILWLCAKIALVVFAAIWLYQRPGTVTIDWLGWRIDDAPVGILILVTLVFAGIMAMLYRFWLFLYRSPRGLGRWRDEGRRQKGFRALGQGMAAVAAGDAGEASRFARKAEGLLQEPPLTMLLSAQAAQLNGDEGAAKRYFTAMLDNDETRFLGLRGLVMQALRDGDDQAALTYTRKAQQLRPKTPWVVTTLAEVSARTGDLAVADEALQSAAKLKALPAAEATGKRATLQLQQALQAEAEGRMEAAHKLARSAHKLAPELLAAALTLGRLAGAAGNTREAQKTLERAWALTPHPGLAEAYLAAKADAGPLDQIKRLGRLVSANANHPESHMALAEASLTANLWGEARRHLEAAAGTAPSARVCRLMARLEEAEHGDAEAARQWLERAATAPADPAWVCESCGALADAWAARCGVCDALDSLNWRQPPRAQTALPVAEVAVVEEPAAPAAAAEDAKSALQASA